MMIDERVGSYANPTSKYRSFSLPSAIENTFSAKVFSPSFSEEVVGGGADRTEMTSGMVEDAMAARRDRWNVRQGVSLE